MSFSPFEPYLGRVLSGKDIRDIVKLGSRSGYSFVLVGPCAIVLRPVKTLVADLRIQRDRILEESYLPYLGELRGPLHLYDPETSEEMPRIRIKVPENLSFPLQREYARCFTQQHVAISVFDQETKQALPATVGLDNTIVESPSGVVVFYGARQGPHALTVLSEGYEPVSKGIVVPPWAFEIGLKKVVVKNYLVRRYAWYLDYKKNEGFPSTPEGKKGKHDLHVRIILSGTIPKDLDEVQMKRVFKENMRDATKATAQYVRREGNGVDATLNNFYKKDEQYGYYGDIETLEERDKYSDQFDYYGFFVNEDYKVGGMPKQYTWRFQWRIDEGQWTTRQTTLA